MDFPATFRYLTVELGSFRVQSSGPRDSLIGSVSYTIR